MAKVNTTEMKNLIIRVASEEGVDPSILLAIAEQESGFNPNARNKSKVEDSVGMFQINTKAHPDYKGGFNPEANARYAAKLFKGLLAATNGDLTQAIAAYNGGMGGRKSKQAQGYSKSVQGKMNKYATVSQNAERIATNINNIPNIKIGSRAGETTGAAANLPTDAITVDVPQAAIMGNPYQYTPDEYRTAATSATNLQNLYNFANQLRPTGENLTDAQLAMLQGSVTPTNPQAYVDMQNAQNQAILQMQQQLAERDRLSQEELARRFSELEQLYNQDPRLTNKGYYIDPNAIATNTVASQAYTNITGRPSTDLQTPEQLAQRLYQAQVANQYGIPYEQYIVAEQRRLENIANVKAAQIEYAVQQLRQQGVNDREIAKMLNNSSFVQEYQKDIQNVRDNAQKNFNTLMQYDPSFQSAMVNQAGGIIQQGQQANQQAMQGAAGYQEALDKQREANIPNLYNTSANLAVGTQGNLLNYDVNKQKAETEAQLAPARGYNYVTTGISNMKFADPTSSVPNLVGNMPSGAQQYVIPQGATPEEINKAYGTQVQAPPTSSAGLLQRAVEYGRRFTTPLQ